MSAVVLRTSGVVAALPMAASATLLIARWLPVHFVYRENQLGVVSLATLQRYPQQQETFWLVFGVVTASLLGWGLSRWLASRRLTVWHWVAVEALAASALAGLLWLPTALALGWTPLAIALALALAARQQPPAPGASPAPEDPPPRPRPRWQQQLLPVGALLLALALTPSFWVHSWSVDHAIPDESRAVDSFSFHGEVGQHLAWADALASGHFHGRDFFCLYGPLYDWGLVATWRLFGRSIAAWELYFSSMVVLGFASLLLLTGLLVRRRWLVLLVPFLIPWLELRYGMALYGLCCVYAWLRGGAARWVLLAGFVAGVALLFSQEYALAYAIAAGLAFALRGRPRPPLTFAAGAAGAVIPLFVWYAANGALLPMLRDLAGYPGYMLAGFGKLPFPALELPLDPARWGTPDLVALQLGYGVPAVCLGALLLALPISKLDPRAPRASLREMRDALNGDPQRTLVILVACFGLLGFRVALGRSDFKHILDSAPAACALVVVGVDRVIGQLRGGRAWRPLAAGRAVALGLLVLQTGFLQTQDRPRSVRYSLRVAGELLRGGYRPHGDPTVVAVARWVSSHTEPGDPVLFLPNNAAYYYLTERASPIRFVMGHQIVTQAHRQEVLEDLRATPPRYVIWDHDALRVDRLPDELVFGAEILEWIQRHYETERRFGGVEVLRPRPGANR